MKKKSNTKKLVGLVVAAVMAFGMVFMPVEAKAVGTTTAGTEGIGTYVVTSTSKKTLTLTGLTAKGKKMATVSIGASIKATGKNSGTYKVTVVKKNAFNKAKATKVILPKTITKIQAAAFNGSKAKVIGIKANIKPGAATNMLKGSKATKITIKVPKKQVAAWKKAAKAGKLGVKGSKVVIKSL